MSDKPEWLGIRIVVAILYEIADEIDKESNCSLCAASDEHEVCESADIGGAIRRVLDRYPYLRKP